ncbi:hypothetical protein HYV50_05415 [Candidatus Pacearchaeota archaeon]|nr:hypothetical protein [Candidatus Pacearchaeota archaeon]
MGSDKRGQVAIFVIIAIVIVVAGILIYYLFPDVRSVISGEIDPTIFIQSCVGEEFKSQIKTLAEQGGYANPEGYILYEDKKAKYLCYTSEYYLPCRVQQPLINENFENELNNAIKNKIDSCFNEMRGEFEDRGYEVSGDISGSDVKIVPNKIQLAMNGKFGATKGEETKTFNEVNYEIPSKMYNLVMIATSIVDFESSLGNTETSLYVGNYPDIIIQKTKLTDGSTVYTVKDATTNEEFTFASRSLAWPGGYGIEA